MTNATRTGAKALAEARSWIGDKYAIGMCLYFQLVEVFGVAGVGDYDGNRRANCADYWKKAKRYGQVKAVSWSKIPVGALVIWSGGSRGDGHAAIKVDAKNIVGTDLPSTGRIGKAPWTYPRDRWGHKLEGYVVVDGNGRRMVPAPTPTPPKPKPTPTRTEVRDWAKHMTWNVGGMNPEGLRTWSTRVPKMVARIAREAADFVYVQELPGAKRKDFDKRMAKIGYARVSGSDGRYIYRRRLLSYVFLNSARRALAGVWDIDGRYQGDDKQAAWAKVRNRVISTPLLAVSAHLENQGPVAVKVKQFRSVCWQTVKRLQALKMPRGREVIAGDFNATADQLRKVMDAYGLVSALEAAPNKPVRNISTAPGLKATATKAGAPIDHILVGKARPVRSARIVTEARGESDHLPIVATLGRFAQVPIK